MSWTQAVEGLAAEFSGTLGLWAKSLDTGEVLAYGSEESFPPASTMKVPVLYEVFRQAGEGRFSLTDPLLLKADDVVGGSGILKDLTPGLTLPVRDLATLMIVYVIAMMSKGCTDTRFYHDNEASVLLPRVSAAVYGHFVPATGI